MTEVGTNQSNLRSKVRVKSFREEQVSNHQENLDSILHSESTEPNFQGFYSETSEQIQNLSFMSLQERYYFVCPQLYSSYRNQKKIEEISGDNFLLHRYSGGRMQFIFRDCYQIWVPDVLTLTVYPSSDFKLIINEFVYFWHDKEATLEKYSVTV